MRVRVREVYVWVSTRRGVTYLDSDFVAVKLVKEIEGALDRLRDAVVVFLEDFPHQIVGVESAWGGGGGEGLVGLVGWWVG